LKVENKWKVFFTNKNLSIKQSELLADYANSLHIKNLPIIFELEHFCFLLGIDKSYVYRVIYRTHLFYRRFAIKKKNNGYRDIQSPYPKLKYIQTWIKDNILDALEISSRSFAYVKSRSILGNAKEHLSNDELLKLDIIDYFGNITVPMVANVFKKIGYSPKLSLQFAQLCCVDNSLPQGAPSSPAISNLIMFDLDNKLEKISEKFNITYSRYADDMSFSGSVIKAEFTLLIEAEIEGFGFKLNAEKRIHKKYGERKIVTGLCITGDKVRVLKKLRREFRQNYHYLKINSENAFNGTYGPFDPLYLDRVIGQGHFIQYIEADNLYVENALINLLDLKKSLLHRR
jgi:RNA-directed DNA polymerase